MHTAWGMEVTMCVRVCIYNARISCGERIKMNAQPTHFHSHLSADLAVATCTDQPCSCFQTASNFIPFPQPPPHPNIASATYSSIAARQAYSSRVHSTSRQPSAGTQPPLLRIRCSNNTGCLGFDLAESKSTFRRLFSEF